MKRSAGLEAMRASREPWDFIVIGGGATGLGTAVEAASRGYRTLLLERHDFAKGTSSRSTKLIHGGVRYLKQGDVPLVLEALRERGLLMRNAPHLVSNRSFIVPTYNWWSGPFYGIGLKLYDMLAGKLGLGPSRNLSREETLKHIPTLEPEGLEGGVIYHDGQFDDARLAITLALSLHERGGYAINHMPVTELLKDDDLVCGVRALDRESGEEHEIFARVVVNATGPFSDAVRCMDQPDAMPVMRPSQGVHIVLPRAFQPGDSAIMVPETDDGRVLFAVPWNDRIILGTTDTPLDAPTLEPKPLEEEIDFLLTHACRYLTRDPTRADVLSVFAGIRPLVAEPDEEDTASTSREHMVMISQSGLVTIAGGKWTTYRKMGQDTVNKAALIGGLAERPSVTADMPLAGADGADLSLRGKEEHWRYYGSAAIQLRELALELPALDRHLHPNLPYRACEVVWAAREEMARTVEDVLARRTRALLLDARASIEVAPEVARLLAAELHQDADWQARQVADYTKVASNYVLSA